MFELGNIPLCNCAFLETTHTHSPVRVCDPSVFSSPQMHLHSESTGVSLTQSELEIEIQSDLLQMGLITFRCCFTGFVN